MGININKNNNNLVFTFCNFCGGIVAGNGRMHLTITFDEIEENNSSIRANVCTSCARKISSTMQEKINKTEVDVIDTKIRLGNYYNSLLPNVELFVDEEIEVELIDDEVIDESKLPLVEVIDTPEPLPRSVEIINPVMIEKKNEVSSDSFRENVNNFCEKHKGHIRNLNSFIENFVEKYPLFMEFKGMDPKAAMPEIQKNINDCKTEYRLKLVSGSWYMHKLTTNTTDVVEVVEEDNANRSNKKWTEEEEEFLKKNYKKLGVIKCSEILGRSKNSCSNKYHFIKD